MKRLRMFAGVICLIFVCSLLVAFAPVKANDYNTAANNSQQTEEHYVGEVLDEESGLYITGLGEDVNGRLSFCATTPDGSILIHGHFEGE